MRYIVTVSRKRPDPYYPFWCVQIQRRDGDMEYGVMVVNPEYWGCTDIDEWCNSRKFFDVIETRRIP